MLFTWRELEAAFCDTSPGFQRYLDLDAGRLVALQSRLLSDSLILQRIAEQPGRFVRIETIPSHVQHEWLSCFIAGVQDPELKARLTETLGSVGVFRRFKELLRRSPVERQRWLDRRSEILQKHIDAWLRVRGISIGQPSPEPRAPSATPETSTEDAELRRIARDKLEILPADALALAVGFLRYLEGRPQ